MQTSNDHPSHITVDKATTSKVGYSKTIRPAQAEPKLPPIESNRNRS